MDKNLVVEIFVPLRGSDEGEIATGYPVAKNLILTARHPLFPKEPKRDDGGCNRDGCKIEVRWRHPGVDAGRWWPVKAIAWESERWGLALLECDLPPGVSTWGLLSEHKPEDVMKWKSAGFPCVGGKKEGIRQPFHLKGSVFSMLDREETFALSATAGPEKEEDWKGASGSPVFVDWRILGVVVSVPARLKAERLRAVPIWRVLREDDGFRKAIRYEERRAHCDQIMGRVEEALESAPGAVEALIRHLPGAVDEQHRDAGAKIVYVAERLLDTEVESLVKACRSAHKAVERHQADAKAITEIVQIVLPAVYDHGVVEAVRNIKGDATASLITVPAYFPTIAEIIMAGVDRRETRFCPREREDDFPKGQLNLPEPPEGGFDPEGEGAMAALTSHLTRKFSSRAQDELGDAVDAFMTRRFYSARAGGPERMPQQKIQTAAQELRYLSEEEGLTHYLILPWCEDADSQHALENTAHRLRERYPTLACLSLATDYALETEERRGFRLLLSLLPKTTGTRR